MNYKDMPYVRYFVLTCLLYIVEILLACATNDVGKIFEFISAVCVSCIGRFVILMEEESIMKNVKQILDGDCIH